LASVILANAAGTPVSNTIGRYMLSWALGRSIPDNQSGYRLISRRLAQDTLAYQESGFEFEVEMVIRCVHWVIRWPGFHPHHLRR